MISIVEQLYHQSIQMPRKKAVIFEKAEISYGELWNKSVHLAHFFRWLGLQEGDRVVIQCQYDLYYVASIYAAHLCGAAVAPVDKNANGEMIGDMAKHIDASLVICNQKMEYFPNCVYYSELADSLSEDTSMDGLAFPELDNVAAILFTTGTTGAPKGVQLTHRNTTAWAVAIFSKSNCDVCLSAVPLNHVAPFMRLHHTIYVGGTMIFLESIMKLGLMFEYIEKYGVTAFYFPPSAVSLIQQLSKDRLSKYVNQIDYVIIGSAAIMESQRDYLKYNLPKTHLYTAYGSSESGIATMYRFDNNEKPINCLGKACPGVELRIVDDSFRPVPIGQVGLIAISSNLVMKGYYKCPELTDTVLCDGFYISSDLGYLDEDGYLYLCGRSDDMINIGGLKVFPAEIENAALKIPDIEECICFGVPDQFTGQAVKLLIKTSGSFTSSITFVKEELSKIMDYYKVPKKIEIVEEIAKTANGKPNRKYYLDQGVN